ncbi:MAG: sigma-70 family RNA polymerase sigma factor [Faecousia sp.]
MSNEELAAAIQAGDTDRMGELWEQVAGLAAWKARHIVEALDGRYGVTFDDLYQSAYPALVAAVGTFQPEKCRFSTWFMYHLKQAFAECTGFRTQAAKNDPVNHALSLDAPIGDEEDSPIFGDLIPDPKAAATMQAVLDREYQRQLHEALETSLSALPALEADVLRMRYYCGMTLAEVAKSKDFEPARIRKMESDALRQLRKPESSRRLRQFYHGTEDRG